MPPGRRAFVPFLRTSPQIRNPASGCTRSSDFRKLRICGKSVKSSINRSTQCICNWSWRLTPRRIVRLQRAFTTKPIRYVVGVVGFLLVWFGVALVVSIIVTLFFPPADGEIVTFGFGFDGR